MADLNSGDDSINSCLESGNEKAMEPNGKDLSSVKLQNTDKDSKNRIIYTKEFLILLKNRENSKKLPGEYLPKMNNDENHWDPENYFDELKPITSANNTKKNHEPKKKTIRNISAPVLRSFFEPGDVVEVNFCSLNTKNSFHVNVSAMKGAIQQLYSAINTYGKLDHVEVELANFDEIYLGMLENFWYRIKLLTNSESNEMIAFCIDNAKEFKPESLISCPNGFANIPPFALNVLLDGVEDTDLDCELILEFAKNNSSFLMKILEICQNCFVVEFYDKDGLNLNNVLKQI